jgi:hypothetical protein
LPTSPAPSRRRRFHDVAPVRDAEGINDVLLDNQDGQAPLADFLHFGEYLLDDLRSQAERRLVEHEQSGLVHQPAGDRHHLLLAPDSVPASCLRRSFSVGRA